MIATLIFIQKMLCLSRRSRHKMINRRNPVVRLCRNIHTRKIAYSTLRTPKGHYQTAQINQHLVNMFVSSSFIKERRETSTSSERQASWPTSTISGHFYNFRGLTRPAFEVIKPFIMLNSTEHEIHPAHKYQNNCCHFNINEQDK